MGEIFKQLEMELKLENEGRKQEARALRDKHLNSRFYTEARTMWEATQKEQILKGADKYPEPFNPKSWTPDQLIQHALQENVDQTHYMVGLYQQLKVQEEEIRVLNAKVNYYESMGVRYDG